jgi:hypothetical protein
MTFPRPTGPGGVAKVVSIPDGTADDALPGVRALGVIVPVVGKREAPAVSAAGTRGVAVVQSGALERVSIVNNRMPCRNFSLFTMKLLTSLLSTQRSLGSGSVPEAQGTRAPSKPTAAETADGCGPGEARFPRSAGQRKAFPMQATGRGQRECQSWRGRIVGFPRPEPERIHGTAKPRVPLTS